MANKPLLVAKEDFMHDLGKLINQSELPTFMVQMILDQISTQLAIAVDQQTREERIRFNLAVVEEKKKEGEKLDAERDQLSADQE